MAQVIIDEKALIERIRDNEREAWNELVDAYGGLIYYSIQRTLEQKGVRKDPDYVQEVFQALFVRLAENQGRRLLGYSGKHQCSFATWIRMITVNYTIDCLRSRSRRGLDVSFEEVPRDEYEQSWSTAVQKPDEVLMEKEKAGEIAACLKGLSGEDRNFLELYLSGVSPRQMAKIFKVSVNGVYSRYRRLKAGLRESLAGKKV